MALGEAGWAEKEEGRPRPRPGVLVMDAIVTGDDDAFGGRSVPRWEACAW